MALSITQLKDELERFFVTRFGNNTIEGHVLPKDNSTFNLGSPSQRFANIYADNLVGSTPAGTDELIAISGADTTPDFLDSKISVSGLLSKSITSPGGDETLALAFDDTRIDALEARDIIAGAGLTGGGDLSADRTLDVVAGNGSIVVGANEIHVGLAHDFNWTGLHTFTDKVTIDDDLEFTGPQKIYTTSGVLQFNGNQDMGTIPFGSSFPIEGWRLEEEVAGYNKLTIGKLILDELHTRYFVADETRISRGIELWTYSYGILTEDFTVPAVGVSTTITIEDVPGITGAVFVEDHWVVIRIVDFSSGAHIYNLWGQVSNYVANIDDTQTWTYTHRRGQIDQSPTEGGLGTTVVKKGSALFDWGATGQGIIEMNALADYGGPFLQMKTWSGTNPYTPANYTVRSVMGRLDSVDNTPFGDLSGYGFFSENAYLTGRLSLGAPTTNMVMSQYGIGILQYDDLDPNPTDNVRAITWYDDLTWAGLNTRDPVARIWAGMGGNFNGIQFDLGTPYITGSSSSSYPKFYMEYDLVGDKANAVFVNFYKLQATVEELRFTVGDMAYMVGPLTTQGIAPDGNETRNLGNPGTRWNNLYVKTIVADTITGDVALGGQTWQYDTGNMYIKSSAAGLRTLYIANPGAGAMNVDIEGNIILTGNVDGVDVFGLSTSFTTHEANPNAHHAKQHAYDDTDHHTGALSWSNVSKTSSSIGDLATKDHDLLSGLADDDHTQYVHNTVARTISAVHIFNPGSATAPFVLHANAQGQTIVGLKADELNKTITAGAGLTGGGILTSDRTLAVGAGNGITVNADDVALASSVAGVGLTYTTGVLAVGEGAGLDVTADAVAVDLTYNFTWTGNYDFNGTVTAFANNTFRVYSHTAGGNHAHLVVNPTGAWSGPDEQFGVDIDDSLLVRGYIVGKHALQIPGATAIMHFDGAEPYATNWLGTLASHMGNKGSSGGGIRYSYGKFGKAVELHEATTNYILNPSFGSGTTGWTASGVTATVVSNLSYNGTYSVELTAGAAPGFFHADGGSRVTVTAGSSVVIQAQCYQNGAGRGRLSIMDYTSSVVRASVDAVKVGEWELLTIAWTNDTGVSKTIGIRLYNLLSDSTSTVYYDAVQLENNTAAANMYIDGSLPGCTWSGTAHVSTSNAANMSYITYAPSIMPKNRGTVLFCVQNAVGQSVCR